MALLSMLLGSTVMRGVKPELMLTHVIALASASASLDGASLVVRPGSDAGGRHRGDLSRPCRPLTHRELSCVSAAFCQTWTMALLRWGAS